MDARIERIDVSAYKVPTDFPESDGTLQWDSTTLVLVSACAGDKTGLGYTYASTSTGELIREKLVDMARGQDAFDVGGTWNRMVRSIRNLGRAGICSMAIAAVDLALWDLKARLLDLPLVKLLGAVRETIPAYGSGGFTSYSMAQLQKQLGGWIDQGLTRVKMKVGRAPDEDPARVRAAREAVGAEAELFVDANGAYSCKQALDKAGAFAEFGVNWFEEPVVSHDFAGQRFVREQAPAGMEIANGEYGYDLPYFQDLLAAGAADVVQADITRCAGLTGFLQAAALCHAHLTPFSSHTAPSLHVHPCCAIPEARHVEYFHDHVRIEHLFFEGAARPVKGELRPDLQRPGFGLEFKKSDAQRYAV